MMKKTKSKSNVGIINLEAIPEMRKRKETYEEIRQREDEELMKLCDGDMKRFMSGLVVRDDKGKVVPLARIEKSELTKEEALDKLLEKGIGDEPLEEFAPDAKTGMEVISGGVDEEADLEKKEEEPDNAEQTDAAGDLTRKDDVKAEESVTEPIALEEEKEMVRIVFEPRKAEEPEREQENEEAVPVQLAVEPVVFESPKAAAAKKTEDDPKEAPKPVIKEDLSQMIAAALAEAPKAETEEADKPARVFVEPVVLAVESKKDEPAEPSSDNRPAFVQVSDVTVKEKKTDAPDIRKPETVKIEPLKAEPATGGAEISPVKDGASAEEDDYDKEYEANRRAASEKEQPKAARSKSRFAGTAKKAETVSGNAVPEGGGLAYIKELISEGAKSVSIPRFDRMIVTFDGNIKKVYKGVFKTEAELEDMIGQITGDAKEPVRNGSLDDGTRFHAIMPPVAKNATIVLEAVPGLNSTAGSFIGSGMVSEQVLDYLRALAKAGLGFLILGDEKSGKTTLLNFLAREIEEDDTEVILQIERRAELSPEILEGAIKEEESEELTFENLCEDSGSLMPAAVVADGLDNASFAALFSAEEDVPLYGTITGVSKTAPVEEAVRKMEAAGRMEDSLSRILKRVSHIVKLATGDDGRKRVQSVVLLAKGKEGKAAFTDVFRYDRNTGKFTGTGFVPKDVLQRFEEHGIEFDKGAFAQTKAVQKAAAAEEEKE